MQRCQISLTNYVLDWWWCTFFIQLLFMFIIYILTGWKIKVSAKRGLDILRIHCQNSAFIMTNGIGHFRQGVDIFDKRILDSIVSSYPTVKFWIRPRLQQSFPCSWQSINRYHSAWCTTYQDLAKKQVLRMFAVSIPWLLKRDINSLLLNNYSNVWFVCLLYHCKLRCARTHAKIEHFCYQ